ncbi:carboxylate-amine ligase [Allostreptomyces psammosilenae]|nr:YbdK family carboxylate-amine ligase [Allostreptomyces psammosilenae]
MGVEEEFLLIDPETRMPLPLAGDVLRTAHGGPSACGGGLPFGAEWATAPPRAHATAPWPPPSETAREHMAELAPVAAGAPYGGGAHGGGPYGGGPHGGGPHTGPSRAAARHSGPLLEGPIGTTPMLKAEFLATQVESASGVCTRLEGLRSQLLAGRRRLAEAARTCGARLVSVGNPVLSDGDPVPSPPPQSENGADRYARIRDLFAGAVADYQACGCHVHVGVPDRETAVQVVNRLRPWLPTLLALSANSPFDHGRDTGCHSWRMIAQGRFPGAGVPPVFESVEDYDAQIARLVDCGAVVDEQMTFWLARPSQHLPTVEVRAADAGTVDGTLLQAALTRALVDTALEDLAEGRPPVRVRDTVAAAAVWCAARYGLRGPAVHPVAERRVPAAELVAELYNVVRPALAERGDEALTSRLLHEALQQTGPERQRDAAAAGGPTAVVDQLIAVTDPGAARFHAASHVEA